MHALKLPRKALWALVLALSTLAMTGCFNRGDHQSFKQDMMFDFIAWKLDLNDQQTARLDAVKTEIQGLKQTLHDHKIKNREKIISMVTSDYVSQEELLTLVHDKRSIIEQRIPHIAAAISELHQTLSPEQKAKIAEHLRDGPLASNLADNE